MDAGDALVDLFEQWTADGWTVTRSAEREGAVIVVPPYKRTPPPPVAVVSPEQAEALLLGVFKSLVPELAWHPFVKAQHVGDGDSHGREVEGGPGV